MNTDVMFSSKTDLWSTPQDFYNRLDAEFHFTLDVCALPENSKCKRYYTPEQNGLSQPWTGVVWCNPPYCRPDVSWFHDYILGKAEIRFIRGRLKFGGSKNSAPFPSMVVVFIPKGGAENEKAQP